MVETVSRPISEAAKLCAIKDYWQATPVAPLLKNLRKITGKPISVGAVPLLAEERQNDSSSAGYSGFLTLSNMMFFEDFNATLIGQPLDTIVNGNASEISYSRMSERLLGGEGNIAIHHPEGENSHMNQSYGTLWLTRYFAGLQA